MTLARRLGFAGTVVALTAAAAIPALAGAGVSAADKLPPGTLRGPAGELEQYPTLSLATPEQRAAATQLWRRTQAATRPWRDPTAAALAGFATRRARRRPGDRSVGYLHAEHRGFRNDGLTLAPDRPETLVYASVPGRPLVLIGVMFGVPRGVHGPTPGGPITRWHMHTVCVRGKRRGLAPRPDGSCPPGSHKLLGSEMMHVWFTRDLRSAFAIHAPVPELCVAHLLRGPACDHAEHSHA